MMMMMMMSNGATSSNNRFPFTASQWQELEHQALVYKYMASGMQIPPDLLFTIRRSLDSSLSSKLLLHQPAVGWNGFPMGFGRKIDPEPGRCRRTDGKKWRCSKDAYPDSKYCERHMHRGRNRSRKPVENLSSPAVAPSTLTATKINTSTHSSSASNVYPNNFHSITSNSYQQESHFLYPHLSSSSRANAGIGSLLSSQHENATTKFFINGYSGHQFAEKSAHRNSGNEHAFLPEVHANSGAMNMIRSCISDNNNNIGPSVSINNHDSSWPLTMGSSLQMKEKPYSGGLGHFQNLTRQQVNQGGQQYYSGYGNIVEGDNNDQPKKVMHHFLDESPPKDNKDSWGSESHEDKSSRANLSMSRPANSLHDFFMTGKW